MSIRAARRIAILLPDLRGGGAERLHLNLAEEWLRRGIRVDFVLMQAHGELLPLLPGDAGIIDLNAPRIRSAMRPLIAYFRAAADTDAVLAAMWPLTVVAPLAARWAGYAGRIGISEHVHLRRWHENFDGVPWVFLRASACVGYRLADVRIGVSSGVADELSRISFLPRSRFTVIYNPAASGRVGSEKPPKPERLKGVRGPLILAVGALKSQKRHDRLIEAFARLSPTLGATLCILGEGAKRPELESRIRSLNLGDRVILPGFALDPSPWYAHADLFVLSSDYEGFGNVIVEAMEHGLPVVSTNCQSGPEEILDGGRYGRLVPVGDVAALAKAIDEALGERVDRAALRARARDFAVEKIADSYLDCLLPDWRDGALA